MNDFTNVIARQVASRMGWAQSGEVDDYGVSPVDDVRSFFDEQRTIAADAWQKVIVPQFDPDDLDLIIETTSLLSTNLLHQKIIAALSAASDASKLSMNRLFLWAGPLSEGTEVVLEDDVPLLESEVPIPYADDQLSFWLAGGFAPTKELTDLWTKSVAELAVEAKVRAGVSLAVTDAELQQEFAKLLSALFGRIAQQIRYSRDRVLEITREGVFTPRFQIDLSDRFTILPLYAAEFLDLLTRELAASVAKGCTISGAWGKIELASNGDLRYSLEEPRMVSDPTFVPAKRIE